MGGADHAVDRARKVVVLLTALRRGDQRINVRRGPARRLASRAPTKDPLPRPIRPVVTPCALTTINGRGVPLVPLFIRTKARDLIRGAAVAVRMATINTVLIIRGRAYVRGRVLARHIGARHEGLIPVRVVPPGRRPEVKAPLPTRPDVRAVPLIVQVIASPLRPLITTPMGAVLVAREAPLDVTQRPARIIRPVAIKARLKGPALPSKPMAVILQVLLAARLRPVVPAAVAPLAPTAPASFTDIKAPRASSRRP